MSPERGSRAPAEPEPDPAVGRVLRVEPERLWLQRPGGELRAVRVRGVAALRPGDLVRLRGGPPARPERVHAHPTGRWPESPDARRFADPERWKQLRRRAELLHATRGFFRDRGFLEVETPCVVPSPGTEIHIAATPASQRPEPGSAPRPRWLRPSPEHAHKRLLAGGAPPIVEIGPVFRDAEAGSRHRAEFTLVEWYRPWAEPDEVMADAEAWLAELAGPGGWSWQGEALDPSPPWPRRGFHELLQDRAGLEAPERLPAEERLALFGERVEPTLGRGRPEWVVDWPIELASLARPRRDAPHLAERFELYVAGLELGNGFGELDDPHEQRRRCERDNRERRALGLPEHPLDEAFLDALAEGLPPSAGLAVGWDRVVMLLTDAADIDRVRAL